MRPSTRFFNAFALALTVYGFAGWLYVAVVSLIIPQALPMRLTHLANWPRTDTFGAFCFAISFVAFIAYLLTRSQRVTRNGR